MALSKYLKPLSFDNLDGWHEDDHLAALSCFSRSAVRMIKESYPTKSLGVDGDELVKIAHKLMISCEFTANFAKGFFQDNFRPCVIDDNNIDGLLTGYFEPQLYASTVKSDRFCHPVFRRPDDLIDLDANNRPKTIDRSYKFARQLGSNIIEYYDRKAIQSGVLDGQGLELYWFDNLIDVFFMHIQGSARLKLQNGKVTRISYAAKSGHPYTPIGKVLVKQGHLELKNVSMGSIIGWLETNPEQIVDIISENRSFIFFKEESDTDMGHGPKGAAGVSLTKNRSLAVDHKIHTYGTPIWILGNKSENGNKIVSNRLLIAQDTGSAIIGSHRGDIFTGSGEIAGEIAGNMNIPSKLIVFVPRAQMS